MNINKAMRDRRTVCSKCQTGFFSFKRCISNHWKYNFTNFQWKKWKNERGSHFNSISSKSCFICVKIKMATLSVLFGVFQPCSHPSSTREGRARATAWVVAWNLLCQQWLVWGLTPQHLSTDTNCPACAPVTHHCPLSTCPARSPLMTTHSQR